MSRLKETMEYLMSVEKEISQFDKLKLTPTNREKLYQTIKKITKDNFTRKDNGKLVELYYGSSHMFGMRPDITIGVDDNRIFIDTWSLWKTIHGFQEQLQEERAYMED